MRVRSEAYKKGANVRYTEGFTVRLTTEGMAKLDEIVNHYDMCRTDCVRAMINTYHKTLLARKGEA